MTTTVLVGYLATGLVFATFCMKRMVPLRTLAISSNIAFIAYGYLGELWPVVILHAVMLPLNIRRLQQAGSAGTPVRHNKMSSDRESASVAHD